MNLRTAILVGILVTLVVASFFLAERRAPVPDDDDTDLQAGYYLKDVELQTTDALGAVKYRLRAARADHDPLDGSIELAQLELDYGNNENRWRFSADRGQMPKTNNSISLQGNVRARTIVAADASRTTFESATLEVDIDGESAATDDPVRMTFAHGTLDGVGLDADFANEHITLRSQIKGVFLPPTR